MFSPWIFKKRIFGIDIDIEFDFWGSIFKTWQAVYEFRLKRLWNSRRNCRDFMAFALKHLPNGSYIIFHFDEYGNEFIQFMRSGTRIILDIPIWETNIFFNKKEDLMKILKDSGIKKGAVDHQRHGETKTELKVDFENHYVKASSVALLICREIFGLKEPSVFKYETHRFAQKK